MSDKEQVRNTFRKSERLCLKNRIELLFKHGISKRAGCLRMIYFKPGKKTESPVQVMFSVPKKQFHRAIERNTLRRYMREAYRLNKQELLEKFGRDKKNLLIGFLFVGSQLETYGVIERNLKQLLSKISKT